MSSARLACKPAVCHVYMCGWSACFRERNNGERAGWGRSAPCSLYGQCTAVSMHDVHCAGFGCESTGCWALMTQSTEVPLIHEPPPLGGGAPPSGISSRSTFTWWTTNLSLHPEFGCNVTNFVIEEASKSTSSRQLASYKEACGPPCGASNP